MQSASSSKTTTVKTKTTSQLLHHSSIDQSVEIEEISKKISEHADALYRTWKSRGLAPTELFEFYNTNMAETSDFLATTTKVVSADANVSTEGLQKLVNTFVIKDKEQRGMKTTTNIKTRTSILKSTNTELVTTAKKPLDQTNVLLAGTAASPKVTQKSLQQHQQQQQHQLLQPQQQQQQQQSQQLAKQTTKPAAATEKQAATAIALQQTVAGKSVGAETLQKIITPKTLNEKSSSSITKVARSASSTTATEAATKSNACAKMVEHETHARHGEPAAKGVCTPTTKVSPMGSVGSSVAKNGAGSTSFTPAALDINLNFDLNLDMNLNLQDVNNLSQLQTQNLLKIKELLQHDNSATTTVGSVKTKKQTSSPATQKLAKTEVSKNAPVTVAVLPSTIVAATVAATSTTATKPKTTTTNKSNKTATPTKASSDNKRNAKSNNVGAAASGDVNVMNVNEKIATTITTASSINNVTISSPSPTTTTTATAANAFPNATPAKSSANANLIADKISSQSGSGTRTTTAKKVANTTQSLTEGTVVNQKEPEALKSLKTQKIASKIVNVKDINISSISSGAAAIKVNREKTEKKEATKPSTASAVIDANASGNNVNIMEVARSNMPAPTKFKSTRAALTNGQDKNLGRPILTRGSVAERVLMFEKCPDVRNSYLNIKRPEITDAPPKSLLKVKLHSTPPPPPEQNSLQKEIRSTKSVYIPRFYFPHGKPQPQIAQERTLRGILSAFDSFPNNQVTKDELPRILKLCGIPFYWRMPVMVFCQQGGSGLVERQRFVEFWKQMNVYCHDGASRFVYILSRGQRFRSFIVPEDLAPLVQDVVDTHPGLAFLKEATEFHSRYVHTVIARIFYTVNRSWSGRITISELKKSDLLEIISLLEEEDDINQIMAFFSYEHFYVIYCKFWELDKDHDLLINQEDLARHSDHALSTRIVERIFSGCVTRTDNKKCPEDEPRMSYTDFVWFLLSEEDKRTPTAIEYWFRCMDIDGDGALSMYELEYFYEEQQQRMESIGIETLPFEDCLCQMLDMIKPQQRDCITLGDLKRCKMTHVFFDTFFNLEKYLDHEQRDPFASQRDEYASDWDRFAAQEYELLITEEND